MCPEWQMLCWYGNPANFYAHVLSEESLETGGEERFSGLLGVSSLPKPTGCLINFRDLMSYWTPSQLSQPRAPSWDGLWVALQDRTTCFIRQEDGGVTAQASKIQWLVYIASLMMPNDASEGKVFAELWGCMTHNFGSHSRFILFKMSFLDCF